MPPVKLGEPQVDDERLRVKIVPGEAAIKDGMELATATLHLSLTGEVNGEGLQARVRLPTGWDRQGTVELPVFVRGE